MASPPNDTRESRRDLAHTRYTSLRPGLWGVGGAAGEDFVVSSHALVTETVSYLVVEAIRIHLSRNMALFTPPLAATPAVSVAKALHAPGNEARLWFARSTRLGRIYVGASRAACYLRIAAMHRRRSQHWEPASRIIAVNTHRISPNCPSFRR